MLGDQVVDDLATDFETRNRPFLVRAHEAAVTDHIGSENCREAALQLRSSFTSEISEPQ